MVRVIRTTQPLVVVSRWSGTPEDGHGQHQAVGQAIIEAFDLAGSQEIFPDLLGEGLTPWQPLKLYLSTNKDIFISGKPNPLLECKEDVLKIKNRLEAEGRFLYMGGGSLYFEATAEEASAIRLDVVGDPNELRLVKLLAEHGEKIDFAFEARATFPHTPYPICEYAAIRELTLGETNGVIKPSRPIENVPPRIRTKTRHVSSVRMSFPLLSRVGTLPVWRCANSHKPDSRSLPIGTRPSCGVSFRPSYSGDSCTLLIEAMA